MGYLKEQHGMTLLGLTQPGTCPECAVAHAPEQPHNQQSLTYQYKFYDEYGRWPTWVDAMAHCPDEVKAVWAEELQRLGVDIEYVPKAECEIEIEIKFEEAPANERKCRVCGCTDNHACPGGCYWVAEDLCSRCAGR